ncbi:hypothetical protein [Clostridium massiliamazoniense]|uniref:hypothetical protein n=1 Tax=Clostridium massiliamazoniense TaxID=1347366 RepID=UPI0006D769FE|nr:hypothetical protein [Clostridium massiliamazoniense]
MINDLELQFEFGIRENYECYIGNLYDGNLDNKDGNLNRLIEYSKEFARFIASNYNIKNISQINLKHFKDFIDLKKIENGVEQATKIGISLLRVENIINIITILSCISHIICMIISLKILKL